MSFASARAVAMHEQLGCSPPRLKWLHSALPELPTPEKERPRLRCNEKVAGFRVSKWIREAGAGVWCTRVPDVGPCKEEIRQGCCMARVWSDGNGAQCRRKASCGEYCKTHAEIALAHGRVDGPVPKAKMKEFEKVGEAKGSKVVILSGRAGGCKRSREQSSCVDVSEARWLSAGEEEGRAGSVRRHHRQVELQGHIGDIGETSRVKVVLGVGDFVFAQFGATCRGAATRSVGKICRLLQDGDEKRAILQRYYTAAEIRGKSPCVHSSELVESNEKAELPLDAIDLQTKGGVVQGALIVHSAAEFAVASLGDRSDAFFCRRMTTSDIPSNAALGATDLVERGQYRASRKFEKAMTALHPGAGGKSLKGREAEQEAITKFVRGAVLGGGQREVLYVSGMPGTGKTASVREVIQRLKENKRRGSPAFTSAEVNAMSLSSPGAVFADICRKVPAVLGSSRKRRRVSESAPLSEKHASAALSQYFSGTDDATRPVLILILDEVDCLVTRWQGVLYKIFEWPARPGARLALIAISNTMDLPERLLPRVSSRTGVSRVNFAPYNRTQLQMILTNRLEVSGAGGAFSDGAIQVCSARVAATSGDVRKALQVCRAAVEARLASGNGEMSEAPITRQEVVAVEADLLRAKPAATAIAGLSLKARRFLLAVVLELRQREGDVALPMKATLRRYEGLMALTNPTQPMEEHRDDAMYIAQRLEAMALLLQRTPRLRLTHGNGNDSSDLTTIELGSSLDVDIVADALTAVVEDDVARDLLGRADSK